MKATKASGRALPFLARRVRRLQPRMMLVNERQPQQAAPGVTRPSPEEFVPDGFVYPKPQDQFFDVSIRVASIPPGTGGNPNVIVQDVWTVQNRIKGGWIRALGYEYNNPHGFFQVRTTLLINSAPPSNYMFWNVDSTTGAISGSFPTLQVGTIAEPTPVFIYLPSNALVQVRLSNASQTEYFSASIRFKGWSFGN